MRRREALTTNDENEKSATCFHSNCSRRPCHLSEMHSCNFTVVQLDDSTKLHNQELVYHPPANPAQSNVQTHASPSPPHQPSQSRNPRLRFPIAFHSPTSHPHPLGYGRHVQHTLPYVLH